MANTKTTDNDLLIESFKKDLQFARNMQFVNRWQGTPQNLPCYNILLHGANCALIYTALCTQLNIDINSTMLIVLLLHDGMETLTGDVLYPAKALAPANWKAVEEIVYSAHREDTSLLLIDNDIECVKLTPAEYLLFKQIDMFEFFLRALEEHNSGNRHVKVIEGLNNAVRVLNSIADEVKEQYATNTDIYRQTALIHDTLIEECLVGDWYEHR